MKRIVCILIAVMLLLSGCSEEKSSVNFMAMDTIVTFTIYGDGSGDAASAAKEELLKLDELFSAYNEKSEIYALNHNRQAAVSELTSELLSQAVFYSELTGGVFCYSMLPLMDAWGFSSGELTIPSAEELEVLLEQCHSLSISLSGSSAELIGDGGVDLGGIAKGYAAVHIAELLSSMGVTSAVLSLGGNVQTIGVKPDGSKWLVAVLDPSDTNAYLGMIESEDEAIVTSGAYQRYFEQDGVRYHHIIDPETGCPADSGVISATVICDNGTMADALSTSLFIMGVEKSSEFWRETGGFDFILVSEDGTVFVTEGIADRFSLSDPNAYTLEVIS